MLRSLKIVGTSSFKMMTSVIMKSLGPCLSRYSPGLIYHDSRVNVSLCSAAANWKDYERRGRDTDHMWCFNCLCLFLLHIHCLFLLITSLFLLHTSTSLFSTDNFLSFIAGFWSATWFARPASPAANRNVNDSIEDSFVWWNEAVPWTISFCSLTFYVGGYRDSGGVKNAHEQHVNDGLSIVTGASTCSFNAETSNWRGVFIASHATTKG